MNKIKNALTFLGFVVFMKNEERKANKKQEWTDGI